MFDGYRHDFECCFADVFVRVEKAVPKIPERLLQCTNKST
jgi:hypothetical protein